MANLFTLSNIDSMSRRALKILEILREYRRSSLLLFEERKSRNIAFAARSLTVWLQQKLKDLNLSEHSGSEGKDTGYM